MDRVIDGCVSPVIGAGQALGATIAKRSMGAVCEQSVESVQKVMAEIEADGSRTLAHHRVVAFGLEARPLTSALLMVRNLAEVRGRMGGLAHAR